MKKRLFMPMNLQYFAEPGEGGNSEAGQAGTSTNSQDGQQSQGANEGAGEGEQNSGKTFTRDDVAKMIAAETAKAIEKVRSETKSQAEIEKKRSEMTPEEQAQFDLKQEREELEADRKALQREKDEASTIKRLATDKLPDSLSIVLSTVYGQEKETIDGAYESVTKAFRDAVEQGINERLVNSAIVPGTSASNNSGSKESLGTRLAKQNLSKQTGSKFFKN